MPTPRTDRIVWTDLETFGLNPATDPILEVGFRITDLDLNTISNFYGICWQPSWYDQLYQDHSREDSFVFRMHERSGLWEDALAKGVSMPEVMVALLAWMEEHEISKGDPIGGSSLGFDRKMLAQWMPQVDEGFSYRIIDISSIKELCMRYAPEVYTHLEDETIQIKAHRVHSDIDDTLNEFKFYRDHFLTVER